MKIPIGGECVNTMCYGLHDRTNLRDVKKESIDLYTSHCVYIN